MRGYDAAKAGETPPDATQPGHMEAEGRKRADAASKRQTDRRAKEETDAKGKDGTDKAWEFQPPDSAALAAMIRGGLEAMRAGTVGKLVALAHKPPSEMEAADIEAFQAMAGVGDLELFCLSAGADGCLQKYKGFLTAYAAEGMLAAGLLFVFANNMKLRATAAEIKDRWETPPQTVKPRP